MSLIGPMGLMSLVGLGGCSREEAEVETPLEVMGLMTDYEDAEGQRRDAEGQRREAVTRAWEPPSGYSLYGSGDQTIGICFTRDGQAPMIGHFFKRSGSWRTNLVDVNSGVYYLYGYIPHTSGTTCHITDLSGDEDGVYSEGAELTLSNVPAVLPSDLCVVIGAKDGTDEETVTGLRSGDFAFNARPTSGETPEANYVFLLFDHLYASIRVRMRVHSEYDALRTIKLKKLKLGTEEGGTPSKQKTNIVITLAPTDGSNPSESPITGINFTPTGENMVGGVEFWSSAGETLTTEYSSYIGFFMPQYVSTLILTSTYDIFDKQGNLIRENDTATNTILLGDFLPGQVTTRRGTQYTINFTIRPTYLYMLSEPDIDDPTVEVTE